MCTKTQNATGRYNGSDSAVRSTLIHMIVVYRFPVRCRLACRPSLMMQWSILGWCYMSGHVFCSCGCWLSARKGWSVVTLCVFVCVLVARIYVLCHWKRYCHEVARTNWRWHGTKKKCVRLIAASPVEWTWLGAHNKFMMMRIVVVGGRLTARDEHKERAISNDSCC